MKHAECTLQTHIAHARQRIGEHDVRCGMRSMQSCENTVEILTRSSLVMSAWWHMREFVMSMFRGNTRARNTQIQLRDMRWGHRQYMSLEYANQIKWAILMSLMNIEQAGKRATYAFNKGETMSCSTMRENGMKWNNGTTTSKTADEMIRLMSFERISTGNATRADWKCLMLIILRSYFASLCVCVCHTCCTQITRDNLKRNIMTNPILICFWTVAFGITSNWSQSSSSS